MTQSLSKKQTPALRVFKKFMGIYMEQIDVPYIPSWARDLTIFKELLEYLSEDELEKIIKLFFLQKYDKYTPAILRYFINDLRHIGKSQAERKRMTNLDKSRYEQ